MTIIPATHRVEIGGLQFKANQGKKQDPVSKENKKKLGVAAHAVNRSYWGSKCRRITVGSTA
jgi:hypothetical protein